MTSFSRLSEHCNDLLCFTPPRDKPELRQPETTRNQVEGQGLPVSTTQQEWPWFSVPCSAESPRNFAMANETNCQHSHWKTSENLVLITFQGFYLSRLDFLWSCISPITPTELSTHWCPETQDPHPAASPPIFGLGMWKNPSQTPAAAQVFILHQWKAVLCAFVYTHTHLHLSVSASICHRSISSGLLSSIYTQEKHGFTWIVQSVTTGV